MPGLITQAKLYSEVSAASSLPTGQPSVLVIDDDPAIVEMLNLVLEDNFRVATCIKAARAVEFALEQLPDLILMDICMPEFDGIQILQQMRLQAKLRHIPVVLMTAGFKSCRLSSHELQILKAQLLAKPFDNDALLQLLHELTA